MRGIYALLRRRAAGPRGPVRRAAQLQSRQPRGGLRLDGALAAARAGRRQAARTVLHAPTRSPICWSSTGARCPANAVTAAQLTDNWIAAAKRQLVTADRDEPCQSALRHALGLAPCRVRLPQAAPSRVARCSLPDPIPSSSAALTRARTSASGTSPSRRSTAPRRPRSGTSRPTTAPLPPSRSPTSSRPRGGAGRDARRHPATTRLAGLLAGAMTPLSRADSRHRRLRSLQRR